MERESLINAFLSAQGLSTAELEWLPSDASFRRYARIQIKENKSYILMDAPPEKERVQPFILIDELLRANDLSAPEIYAKDEKNGLLLLEDFGNNSYAHLIGQGADEAKLYDTALQALFQIAQIKNIPQSVPDYYQNWTDKGLMCFLDWFMPCCLNRELSNDEKQSFMDIFHALFKSIEATEKGLILLDFHIDNMILLDRIGAKACGLLDFQDAHFGPLAYDLVSLIEDARRDISPKLQARLFTSYCSQSFIKDKELFERAYHILAVKRHLRVIGVFVRLYLRDGKDKYLKHLARVWRLLETHLSQPYLSDLNAWLDRYVALDKRGGFPCP